MNEKAAEQTNPPANVVNPAKPGLFQNQWRLFAAVAAAIAMIVIIAVLVFEVMEFLHYRQSPSIWPPAVQAK